MKMYFFDRKDHKVWREAKKEDLHMQVCKFLGWNSPKDCVALIIAHTTQIMGHVQMLESFTRHYPEYKNINPDVAGTLHFKGYVMSWDSPTLDVQTPAKLMSPIQKALMILLEK